MKLDPRPSWMFLSSADLCALIEGQAVGQHQPFQSAATIKRAKELVRSRVRAADHLRAQHQGRTFPDLVRRLKDIHCGVEPESFPAWITSRGTYTTPAVTS